MVTKETHDQGHELHLLLCLDGHQPRLLMLGEAEGGRIVPGQEVFGVEEQAAHADQGAVDPGVRTNCFA